MIERNFDVPFIACLALREKQIQQNYRPIIAVHKWFARRPGTLFRALLLSEFTDTPLHQAFYQANDLSGRHIADPFMGGGTPLFEANRLGCEVTGYDINPMAWWVVKEELEHIDLRRYKAAAEALRATLRDQIGSLYKTTCLECGSTDADVKYFLWVKTVVCPGCGRMVDLFPGYLLAQDRRHPMNVFVCHACGSLHETPDRKEPGRCGACNAMIEVRGPAQRGKCSCANCGRAVSYPDARNGPPQHRMFAIEYHCVACQSRHTGRFFKRADELDLQRYASAEGMLDRLTTWYVPDDAIPAGDESDRLHRWGYRYYREMFNARQLLGLELSARLIHGVPEQRVRHALATNLSDLLRYQNMLCRYDAMALKSLDVFSVHGFPVGLIQCESNLLGIVSSPKGTSIGSGGWSNIVDKFAKAKAYCDRPFEIEVVGSSKRQIPIHGEWIGDTRNGRSGAPDRPIHLHCVDAATANLPDNSLDGVFTDPPYVGNVQYAELMDFCYVWLRRLVGEEAPCFQEKVTTRHAAELTQNISMGRDIRHFTDGLAAVFTRMANALKPGAPLAFTFHHNDIEGYGPVAVAILDAGLTCSASLPCPAEMSASIHINGTGSSIVDTVFVCRSTGRVPRRMVADTSEALAALIAGDAQRLRRAFAPTRGDIRCITFGHLMRLAVWHLRTSWQASAPAAERLAKVRGWIGGFCDLDTLLGTVADAEAAPASRAPAHVREDAALYGEEEPLVSF